MVTVVCPLCISMVAEGTEQNEASRETLCVWLGWVWASGGDSKGLDTGKDLWSLMMSVKDCPAARP